mgnify:CR=1 FL=1
MAGEWARALHYLPSLTAFVIGVIMACWLRRLVGARAAPISLLVEIIFSFWSPFCTTGSPALPARSAFPSSPRCRRQAFLGWKRGVYSSVMATTNLRQAIEGFFIALTGSV